MVGNIRSMFAATCVLAAMEAGCGQQLVDGRAQPGSLGSLFRTACFIRYQNGSVPYAGPDGRTVPLTAAECDQKNQDAQTAAQEADQARTAAMQRAVQEEQAGQRAREAAVAKAASDEWARGYRHVTVKDLLLDGKVYAGEGAKVAVAGFYKLQGRRDERLYASYNDFMMNTYSGVEARYVGLLPDDGSRPLREYLMHCAARGGCEVTILGHVSPCVETNAFGASAGDFCLVAEDMRRPND